jgi:hypothetical protein
LYQSITSQNGSGSTAHFVWKCGLCKRESTAKFDAKNRPQAYTTDSNGGFAPFLEIDCRGLEFIGFDPRGMWTAVGVESGTRFDEVDLSDGEWVDYDEKVGTSFTNLNVGDSDRKTSQPFQLASPKLKANGAEHDCVHYRLLNKSPCSNSIKL